MRRQKHVNNKSTSLAREGECHEFSRFPSLFCFTVVYRRENVLSPSAINAERATEQTERGSAKDGCCAVDTNGHIVRSHPRILGNVEYLGRVEYFTVRCQTCPATEDEDQVSDAEHARTNARKEHRRHGVPAAVVRVVDFDRSKSVAVAVGAAEHVDRRHFVVDARRTECARFAHIRAQVALACSRIEDFSGFHRQIEDARASDAQNHLVQMYAGETVAGRA